MDTIVYESRDTTILSMIEEALKDNGIPCRIIGGADVGLASSHLVRVSVSDKFKEEASDIVKQITG